MGVRGTAKDAKGAKNVWGCGTAKGAKNVWRFGGRPTNCSSAVLQLCPSLYSSDEAL